MKFTINTYITLLICLLLTGPRVFAQEAFHFTADAEVNANDSVVLRLQEYVGDIQWQKSYDIEKWDNIDGATADTLLFVADTTTYFRAEVIAGDCDPFYSDTIFISVYRTTKEAILVDRYDLTLVSDSTQIAAGLFEYEGDVDEIEIGSILVSNQGYGYMRKVTGIRSEKSSTTIFETEQAVLTDVVEEMNLVDSLLITLSDAPTKKAYVNGRPVPVQTLYMIPGAKLKSAKSGIDLSGVNFNIEAKQGDLTGTISATITDGHILFEPVFYRELDIDWVPPRVNNFKLAAGGNIEFHCDVTVESNIDVTRVEDKLRIMVLLIGPIPIGPVTMFIEYSIEKFFKAGLSVSGEISFGFESNFGASYNRDHEPQWNPIFDAKESFNQKPFDFNLTANAYAQFGIGPRFDATIAGFAGPYLSVKPYLRGDLTASWPSDWSFKFSTGIGSRLGFEVGILNRSLINFYTTLPGLSWTIFEIGGDYEHEEPVVETLPIVNITSSSARSGGNVLVEGSSSVTARGVVWSTEENPTLENSEGLTEDGTGAGEFTSEITGLSPEKGYYVRAYATNSAGTAYGEQESFETKEEEVITYTLNLSVSPSGSGEVTGAGSYQEGEQVEITATANEGFDFVNWTGDTDYIYNAGVASTTVTMPTYDLSLTANFEQEDDDNGDGLTGEPCPGMPTFTDPRDGNVYNTVQIGDQCWLKEDLKYLPEVSPSSAGSHIDPHYYVFGYEGTSVSEAKATDNYQNYGVLYNWPAAMNGAGTSSANPSGVQGVCPAGWHLPSNLEWTQLVDYVVDQGYPNEWNNPNGAGNALKSCRQIDSSLGGECDTSEHPRWRSHSTHYGTDQFGFSALPGGCRDDVVFVNIGIDGLWWSSTEGSSAGAWSRVVCSYSGGVGCYYGGKEDGYSVRCIKN